MKSVLTQSPKSAIAQALTQCRDLTLQLANISDRTLTQQSHPDFSPIGWHLGHIAFTEAYWILEQLAQQPPSYPEYHKLFAADGLPKAQRQNLPSLDAIKDYLATVRAKTLDYLEIAPIETQQRLWWWLIQHESQHNETIAFVKQLHNLRDGALFSLNTNHSPDAIEPLMVKIAAGEFVMGSDEIEAQDNERPAHLVYLDDYYIDVYPVTCGQYRQFIIAGGYQNSRYWSEEGWQWLQKNLVSQPLYWLDSSQYRNHPVCGVSYYEAEAYANFVGKKLPTEAQWEKAAQFKLDSSKQVNIKRENLANHYLKGNNSNAIAHTTPVNAYPEAQTMWGCYDMLGNVWEWTNSRFAGYTGFSSYPYKGYSEVYFDDRHYILKGGSYATHPWALRSSFRNWYHPWVRQIFAGFRCVKQ